LRARGETVRVLDLAAPKHRDDVQGSITDQSDVAAAIKGVNAVYHLAGNAQLWSRDPSAFHLINGEGTRIVVEAAKSADVKRFVHCSSLTTLVGRGAPIGESFADETLRYEPQEMLGAYPRSKLEAERHVEEAVRNGLDAVIVLPTEILGAGDENLTPPTKMILDFANGKTPASIDCILNFVPACSLADGLIAAHDRGRPGQRYLLGGENIPMRRLLPMIEEITGRAMPTTVLPYWVALAAGAIETGLVAPVIGKPPKAPLTGVRLAGRQVSFSSEKAALELGWRAGDVRQALKETIDGFRSAGLLTS
jgi:dihydroflavonol-4-reductase